MTEWITVETKLIDELRARVKKLAKAKRELEKELNRMDLLYWEYHTKFVQSEQRVQELEGRLGVEQCKHETECNASEGLREVIRAALRGLVKPIPGYPTPADVAYGVLESALKGRLGNEVQNHEE